MDYQQTMIRNRICTIPLALAVLGLPTMSLAQAPSDPWVVEVLRAYIEGISLLPEVDPFGPEALRAPHPALPSANARDEEWLDYIKRMTNATTAYLEDCGIEVVPGTLFLPDTRSSTIAVYAPTSQLKMLRKEMGRRHRNFPESITTQGWIMDAPASAVNSLLVETRGQWSHEAAFARLESLVREGRASVVQELRMESRSGGTSTFTGGGESSVSRSSLPYTLYLKMEPVIDPSRQIVDLTVSMTEAEDGESVSKLDTTTSVVAGVPKLTAVWSPSFTGTKAREPMLRMLFLQADVTTIPPPANLSLQSILTRLASKITLSKRSQAVEKKVPPAPGLEVKKYRVPPSFLSSSVPPKEGELAPKMTTVQIIMNECGMEFPEGSSAIFNTMAGVVTLTHTAANHERFAALLKRLRERGGSALQHTVHIVQGERQVLQKLAAELSVAADPAAFWSQALAQATVQKTPFHVVECARLEGLPMAKISLQARGSNSSAESSDAEKHFPELDSAGLVYKADTVSNPEGRVIETELVFEYRGAPTSNQVATVESTVGLRSGIPTVVAEWLPPETPETKGKDLLRMAVLQIDHVWIPLAEE